MIPVNLPTVQQQTNSIDCGVFAIAYATEFCFNQYTGGKGLTFNTSVMRDHLLQCLKSSCRLAENDIITRGVTVKNQQVAVRGNYENPTNDGKIVLLFQTYNIILYVHAFLFC
jgi:Ulp1 family protease